MHSVSVINWVGGGGERGPTSYFMQQYLYAIYGVQEIISCTPYIKNPK